MSKWRPTTDSAIYAIPDIHGDWSLLQNVLKRILPLRRNKGVRDRIIFLGNFLGGKKGSLSLLEEVIKLKSKYPDQVTFLLGENEWLLQRLLLYPSAYNYIEWAKQGLSLLIGYIEQNNIALSNPMEIDHFRFQSLVPEEHKSFIYTLKPYLEIDDYIFVHKGCDPLSPLKDQSTESLIFDDGLWEIAYDEEQPFSKTVVMGGHKYGPWISSQVLMLDGSSNDRLPVMEIKSLSAYEARRGQNRLVKLDAMKPAGQGFHLVTKFNKRFGKEKEKIIDF